MAGQLRTVFFRRQHTIPAPGERYLLCGWCYGVLANLDPVLGSCAASFQARHLFRGSLPCGWLWGSYNLSVAWS
jgi:hypothetical protein